MGCWDPQDLVRRLGGVLDVAEQVLLRLAAEGFTDESDPALNVRAEKAIAETGLLIRAASAVESQPELDRRVRRLTNLLVPYARGPRMRMGICFEPALALDYAQAHACLVRMGHGDTAFDDLLRQALSAQASGSRERPPHRVLEQLWTAESCGLQSLVRSPPCDVLLSQSVLAGPPDLLSGSREDFYAFTHALMYVTDPDLSRKRLPRPQAEILSEANVLLARCLDEEDYDLAGEILLAWPAFGAPWSATATFAFRVLTYVEDEAGFLPSAGLRIERANALTGSDRANYVLATSYHTAYVMGLLCAACLRDGHSPPAEICGAAASADVRTFARATVSPDNERPHWTLVFNRLTESEQDSLAEFVMDVALQRAVRSRDLEAAMKVLTLAHENSMSDAPGWSQAAEYLLRVGALGEHPPPARPTALSR